MMGEVAGRLARIWLGWTFALAVAVGVVGLIYGWRTFVLAAIGAGVVDVWLIIGCIRAWLAVGSYRWFWWVR